MCGIVGLFLKNKDRQPELGQMLSRMLVTMSARGPDSAGIAVYGAGDDDKVKLTLRIADGVDPESLKSKIATALGAPITVRVRSSHIVLTVTRLQEASALDWLRRHKADVQFVSAGANMEIYKEVGLPEHVAREFGVADMHGTHGIGHTRMATESAVTTEGAHPFSTGKDQCLVHNGSLSNHNAVRRTLQREGLAFSTQNDSEVAAGYLTWRMSQGASLRDSLSSSLNDLDGFFTFVVPAIMAESDDYVAFGSEYRALSVLPNIERARVFEPEPATVYAWEHS